MAKERANLLPLVIDHGARAQAEIGKVVYHQAVLRWTRWELELPLSYIGRQPGKQVFN
jgi:hypothetical protein